jgi:dienelactone hydrolase
LHRFLTEAGYVVAAPSFPTGFQFPNMARDVSAVITDLLARTSGPVAGLVDGERVGYIGTSMGGMIGLSLYQSALRDPRIDAVVVKAGSAPSGTYAWAGGPPLLMLHGDADVTVTYASGQAAFVQAARPKAWIRLAGVGHDLNVGSSRILSDAPLGFFARYLRGQAGGLDTVRAAVAATPIATLDAQW